MAMVELIVEKRDRWKFEDLHDLPDETGWKFEISDGILEMSPPPEVDHQALANLLAIAVNHALLPELFAMVEVGVDLGSSYRVPDVVVTPRRGRQRGAKLLLPESVLLAVEIVSPDSVTRDRITKPAQYAAAGIPAYWRVEDTSGITVTAYALRDGSDVYTELGTWAEGDTLIVTEPFELAIAIDDLVP